MKKDKNDPPVEKLIHFISSSSVNDELQRQALEEIIRLQKYINENTNLNAFFKYLQKLLSSTSKNPNRTSVSVHSLDRKLLFEMHKLHFRLSLHPSATIRKYARPFRSALEEWIDSVNGYLTENEWEMIFQEAKKEGLPQPSKTTLGHNPLYQHRITPYAVLKQLFQTGLHAESELPSIENAANEMIAKLDHSDPDLFLTIQKTFQDQSDTPPDKQLAINRQLLMKFHALHFRMTHFGTLYERQKTLFFRRALVAWIDSVNGSLTLDEWQQLLQQMSQPEQPIPAKKALIQNDLIRKLSTAEQNQLFAFSKQLQARAQNEPFYQLKALFLNESLSDEQWNQVKQAIQSLTAAVKEPERYSVLFSQLSSIFNDGTDKPKTSTKPFNNRSILIDLHSVHFYLTHYSPEHIQKQTRSFRRALEDWILVVDGMLTHNEWNQIFVQATQEGLSIPSNSALQQNKLYKNQKTPYPELIKLLQNSPLGPISLSNLHAELNDIQSKLHQSDTSRTLLRTLQYLVEHLPSEIHKNQQSIPRPIIRQLVLLHFHMTHSGTSHDKNLSAPFRQAIEQWFDAAGVRLTVTDWEQIIQNYTQQTKTTFNQKGLTRNELFHKLKPSSQKEVYFFLKWHQRQMLSPWEMAQLIQQMNQIEYGQSKTWQKRYRPEIEKLQRLVSSEKTTTEQDPAIIDWSKWEVDYFVYLVRHLQPNQTLSEDQSNDLLAILYKWSKDLTRIAAYKKHAKIMEETLRFLRPFRQRLAAHETFELNLTDQQQKLLTAFIKFLNQLDAAKQNIIQSFQSIGARHDYCSRPLYHLQQSFRIDAPLLPAPIIGERVHEKQVKAFLDDCRLLPINDTDQPIIQRLQDHLHMFLQQLNAFLKEDSEILKKKVHSFIKPFQIELSQQPLQGITVSQTHLFLTFSALSEKFEQLNHHLKELRKQQIIHTKGWYNSFDKLETLAKKFDPEPVHQPSPFAPYTALAKTCNRLLQIDDFGVFKARLLTLLSSMKKQEFSLNAVQESKKSYAGHFRTLLLLYAVQAKAEQFGLVENDPLQIKLTNAIRSFPWEEEWMSNEEKKALAADFLQEGRTVPSFIKKSWVPQASMLAPSRTAFSSEKLNQILDAIMFQQMRDHKRLQIIWGITDLPPVQEMTALEQQQILSSYIRLGLILQNAKKKSLPTELVSTLQSIQQKLQGHFNPLSLSKSEIGQVFQHLKTKGYSYSLPTVIHFQIVERMSQGFQLLNEQQEGRYQMTHQETANLKEAVNLINHQFDYLRKQASHEKQFVRTLVKHLQQQIEAKRTKHPLSSNQIQHEDYEKPSLLLRSQLNQALSGLHARLSILTLEGILPSTTNLMLAIQPYMQNMNPTQRYQLQTQLQSAGYPDHSIKQVFNTPTYAFLAVEKLQREEGVLLLDILVQKQDQHSK
jgi:hypothetical protein